jgi:hypothetical protein
MLRLTVGTLLVAVSTAFCQAGPIRTVFLLGQSIPGQTGRTFEATYPFPSINEAGQVVFKARDDLGRHGVFVERGGSIVRVGGTSLNFTIQDPIVASSGQIIFLNQASLWHETTGTAQSISFPSPVFAPRSLLLSKQGQAAFVSASGELWRIVGNQAQLAYGVGTSAPDAGQGQTFATYFSPVMNPAGRFAFSANLQGPGVTDENRSGVWSEGDGTIRLVARSGDPAPGAEGLRFFGLSDVSINSSGRVAFNKALVDAANTVVGHGLWTGVPGDIRPLVKTGDPAHGLAAGINFNRFGTPLINQSEEVSFVGTLIGPGVVAANDSGVWTLAENGARLVAREGDQAPGAPVGAVFTEFRTLYKNALGQVAFYAHFVGPNVDDFGIWATDVEGNLRSITQEGKLFEMAPGVTRRIDLVWFPLNQNYSRFTNNEDGQATILNDRGEIAFIASGYDPATGQRTTGLFVSSLVAIPEPSARALSASLIAVAVLAVAERKRRIAMALAPHG